MPAELPDPPSSMPPERPGRTPNDALSPSLWQSGEKPMVAPPPGTGPRGLAKKGEAIGAFTVVDEIARGGMGVVYRVRRSDSDSEAEFALKLVNDAALDAEGRARFQREMEALGRATGHPNIVRVSTSGL